MKSGENRTSGRDGTLHSRDVVAVLSLHEDIAAEVHEVERAEAHGRLVGGGHDARPPGFPLPQLKKKTDEMSCHVSSLSRRLKVEETNDAAHRPGDPPTTTRDAARDRETLR